MADYIGWGTGPRGRGRWGLDLITSDLAGSALTSFAGSFSISQSVFLDGLSATLDVGYFSIPATVFLDGQGATTFSGVVFTDNSLRVTLSGQGATTSSSSVFFDNALRITPYGQELIASSGIVFADSAVRVTPSGLSLSSLGGDFAVEIYNVKLSGGLLSTSIGRVTVWIEVDGNFPTIWTVVN